MIGMLWFDNDMKKDLVLKITEAAAYYRAKYGATPTFCYLPFGSVTPTVEGLEIKATKQIQGNHLWIGVKK